MREAFFFAVAAGSFVAIVWGGTDADASVEGDAAAIAEAKAEIAQAQTDKSYAAWTSGETILPREGDGHFYASVAINGTPVNFMVDTGASMVALTGADARAAGLYWNEADVRVVAQGASGPVYGVTVQLDHVSLGGHEASNVHGVIVPEGLGVSLLGQSFLRTIEPVRIESDRMVLGG